MNTHNTAPNKFIEAGGSRYAYRRFGKPGGTPILLMHHFIGTMDWWDSNLTDSLAAAREVILFDNRGVGISSGETPDRIESMAVDAHAFVHALGLEQVDILGFSLGGFIAQQFALTYPTAARKIILAGTGPQGGEGMQEVRADVVKALTSGGDPKLARPYLFFSQSRQGQTAAQEFMTRQEGRKRDLDPTSSMQSMQAQGEARGHWGNSSRADYVKQLRQFKHPTLIVNGNDDIMVPTVNSYAMAQAIPRSQLIIYPDSGHGALFQYADLFVHHSNLFLDRNDI